MLGLITLKKKHIKIKAKQYYHISYTSTVTDQQKKNKLKQTLLKDTSKEQVHRQNMLKFLVFIQL